MSLLGPYLVACALLVIAGLAKALDPTTTATALGRQLGVTPRRLRPAVRAVAAAEATVGLLALAWPTPVLAALVAISYAGFAVVVARLRATGGPLSGCGCFGTPDTPATGLHLVVNGVLGLAALAVAGSGTGGSLPQLLAAQPGNGLPLALVAATGTWSALLALTQLPRLQAVRQLLVEGSPAT